MPNFNAHKQQIENNTNFFKDINDKFNNKYFDWKVTTLFYTILHCVEALGAKRNGRHITNHQDREAFVHSTLEPGEYAQYRLLANASRRSRYDADLFSQAARNYCIDVYKNTYLPLKNTFDNKYLK